MSRLIQLGLIQLGTIIIIFMFVFISSGKGKWRRGRGGMGESEQEEGIEEYFSVAFLQSALAFVAPQFHLANVVVGRLGRLGGMAAASREQEGELQGRRYWQGTWRPGRKA